MRRVMTQINSAKLPHELVDIEIVTQVPQLDASLDESGERATPLVLQFKDLVPDLPLDVIEFEKTRRHRTSSGQPGALRPSEPIANQGLQAREAFGCTHRGLDDVRVRELRGMRQQFDLHLFFRAEVREQAAFGHSDLIGQNPEGDAAQARLAHQR